MEQQNYTKYRSILDIVSDLNLDKIDVEVLTNLINEFKTLQFNQEKRIIILPPNKILYDMTLNGPQGRDYYIKVESTNEFI
jgi:hypothetical protein